MGIFSSNKQWSTQARTQDRANRARQSRRRHQAAEQRRRNREEIIRHPARSLIRSIFS